MNMTIASSFSIISIPPNVSVMKSLMVISLFFFWFALCECVYDDCLNGKVLVTCMVIFVINYNYNYIGNVNLLKLEINETYDVKLCNNSFVLASELTSSFGIEFADNLLLSSWWLPSGKKITEAVNGVTVTGRELQCYNDQITVNGVYTCGLSKGENLYVGIYRNTSNGKTDLKSQNLTCNLFILQIC